MKILTYRLYIFTALIILTIPCNANITTKQDRSSISGRVLFEGEGLFATIYTKGTTYGTSTNADGNFILINLPAGIHVISVNALGYRSIEKEIKLEESRNLELIFNLDKIFIFWKRLLFQVAELVY